jgi:type 2 lantibiotic biosynthesis protein LanM
MTLDGAWSAALTLAERRTLLRATPGDAGVLRPELEARGSDIDRLRAWQSQSPFDMDAYFERRLRSEGVSLPEFARVLAAPAAAIGERLTRKPTWVAQLEQSLAAPETESLPTAVVNVPRELIGFFELIQPLLTRARRQLRSDAARLRRAHRLAPFDPSAVDVALLDLVLPELMLISARTLILELWLASLQNRLPGETPEDRYRHFIELLRQSSYRRDLLEAYPVLARLLATRIDYWRGFALELLVRLCEDWTNILARFNRGQNPGRLVKATGRLGDSHRRGRSVVALEFASGMRLVYKPRSLAADVHFSELLSWLNRRGWRPALRTPTVLDRPGYGWAEFCAPQPCRSSAELRRFFQRQGGYLAVLYVLQATDLHSDNVVACGEHPVIVDLEALMQPSLSHRPTGDAPSLAVRLLATSVLRVGFLPFKAWGNADADGVDISALGAGGGQLSPFDVPRFEQLGTDRLHIGRGRVPLRERPSRPAVAGQPPVDISHHINDLSDGFVQMYRLLLDSKDLLLSDGGPLAGFAQDEIRIVLRETRTYGILLFESYHPDVLRDALDRDLLLDRLWVEVPLRPEVQQLIPAERADLTVGDVPHFTTRPYSRDLSSGSGDLLSDVFAECGMAGVRKVVHRLGEADLERQLWLIRASMASPATGKGRNDKIAERRDQASAEPLARPAKQAACAVDHGRLIDAANIIGERLSTLAIRGGDDVAWLGLAAGQRSRSPVVVLGCDLYDGIAGISLFLGHLAAVTGEERYRSLALTAARTLQRQVDQAHAETRMIGAFSGWGGIMYAYAALATVCNAPELLRLAEAIGTERLPELIESDRQFDVVGGAAGCIASLLAAHHLGGAPSLLELAERCGDHLVRHALRMEHGTGWVNPSFGPKALTGFSHGAAGIAWALLRLGRISGHDRFEATARDALRYERTLFLPQKSNWPDLREVGEDDPATEPVIDRCMTAWCHGAPGIGLSRVDLLRDGEDPVLLDEVRSAVSATVTAGFGGNHSLCHGDLGNLEFLDAAGAVLNDPAIDRISRNVVTSVLPDIASGGWRCGTPYGVESPGLMTGLAGIGYGLLRLADPQTPSVLLLATST